VAENGSIFPQRHHTTCGQGGGRPKFNHGQTMGDRKKEKKTTLLCNSSQDAPWEILSERLVRPISALTLASLRRLEHSS